MLPVDTYYEIFGFMNLGECQNLITLSATMSNVFNYHMKLKNHKRWLQLPQEIRSMIESLGDELNKLEGDVALLLPFITAEEARPIQNYLSLLKSQFGHYCDAIKNNEEMRALMTQRTKIIAENVLPNNLDRSAMFRSFDGLAVEEQMKVLIKNLQEAGCPEAIAAKGHHCSIQVSQAGITSVVGTLETMVAKERTRIFDLLINKTLPSHSVQGTIENPVVDTRSNLRLFNTSNQVIPHTQSHSWRPPPNQVFPHTQSHSWRPPYYNLSLTANTTQGEPVFPEYAASHNYTLDNHLMSSNVSQHDQVASSSRQNDSERHRHFPYSTDTHGAKRSGARQVPVYTFRKLNNGSYQCIACPWFVRKMKSYVHIHMMEKHGRDSDEFLIEGED